MEPPRGSGILARLGERILSWIALGVLVAIAIGIWRLGPSGRAALLEGIWRTLAWIALAGALPWSTRPFMRRVLEIGSNWAGLVLLGALGVIDALAGMALLGGWPESGWGWVVAVGALALAVTYNYLVLEYLAEMAGG